MFCSELINPEDIHIALKVFEKDVPYWKVGQSKAHLVNDPAKSISPRSYDQPEHG